MGTTVFVRTLGLCPDTQEYNTDKISYDFLRNE